MEGENRTPDNQLAKSYMLRSKPNAPRETCHLMAQVPARKM